MKYSSTYLLTALLTTLLLLGAALAAQAYDPMRGMRGGRVATGHAFGTFDALTAHTDIVNPPFFTEGDKIRISAAYNLASFTQYKDLIAVADDLQAVLEFGEEKNLTYQEAAIQIEDMRTKLSNLFDQGTLVSGMVSVSQLPAITWSSHKIRGTFFFDQQQEAPGAVNIPRDSSLWVIYNDTPYVFRPGVIYNDLPYAFGLGVAYNDDLTIDTNNGRCSIEINANNCSITTSSTIDLRGVTNFSSYSLGYALPVYKLVHADNSWLRGVMIVGGRVNYFAYTTGASAINISSNTDTTLLKVVKNLENNGKDNQGIDFDLGISWVNPHYVVGLSAANLLTPKIKYVDGAEVDPGLPISAHAAYFFIPGSQRWAVRMSHDLSGHKDPVGGKYRWYGLSLGYDGSRGWLIPGIELGRQQNLAAETGLMYTSVALKFFRILRLYAVVSDKTVSGFSRPYAVVFDKAVSGIPLSLMSGASLGFDF